MKQDEIQKLREFVALMIRRWRGNLSIAGIYKPDKELAKLVGITPTAFSRLANETTTATLLVYRSLQCAIVQTLGVDVLTDICRACRLQVYGDEYFSITKR